MKVTLLYHPDCPSHERALELVREALEAEGVDTEIEVIRIETEEEAERHRFIGSPTIRINGVEVDPQPHLPYRLTCRTFRHEDGRLSPLPPPIMLREVIHQVKQEEEPSHGSGAG
jgi:glutaredoxin